jgi:hypothetical protein
MEFRIAPILFAAFNLMFLLSKMYYYFTEMQLPNIKHLGLSIVFVLVAFGALQGHHYLSKQYKIIFWTLEIASLLCVLFLGSKCV